MLLTYTQPDANEMPIVKNYVKDFVLDHEDLREEQFIIAKNKTEVVGFGRLKNHTDCIELCTLGVVAEYRSKGIGESLVKKLIEKGGERTVYVVCIIPLFFQKFGFEITEYYPDSIKKKHKMCTEDFVVEEEYCVMKYNA